MILPLCYVSVIYQAAHVHGLHVFEHPLLAEHPEEPIMDPEDALDLKQLAEMPQVRHASGLARDPDLSKCDWQCYLDRNPDLKKVFGRRFPNNVKTVKHHYVTAGYSEGRQCGCNASQHTTTPTTSSDCIAAWMDAGMQPLASTGRDPARPIPRWRNDTIERALPEQNGNISGGAQWPYFRQGVPDVFVHWFPDDHNDWIYLPAILTVGSALSERGANVAYTRQEHLVGVVESVKESARHGRRIIIVGFAYWAASVREETKAVFEECGQRGAFIVLYQTETLSYHRASIMPLIAESARRYYASEVWDYSKANLEVLAKAMPSITSRFFPPGYSEVLDGNVGLYHKLRDEARIGFLGRWEYRSAHNSSKSVYTSLLNKSLVSATNVSSADSLANFLGQYPIQLNTHRADKCCPSTNPTEAFRFSQLLSNRACIVSSRSYIDDERFWQGMVHFVEAPAIAEHVSAIQKDVRTCQMQSYTKFKQCCTPSRLLESSGFSVVLEVLGL